MFVSECVNFEITETHPSGDVTISWMYESGAWGEIWVGDIGVVSKAMGSG